MGGHASLHENKPAGTHCLTKPVDGEGKRFIVNTEIVTRRKLDLDCQI